MDQDNHKPLLDTVLPDLAEYRKQIADAEKQEQLASEYIGLDMSVHSKRIRFLQALYIAELEKELINRRMADK